MRFYGPVNAENRGRGYDTSQKLLRAELLNYSGKRKSQKVNPMYGVIIRIIDEW
jgi:hypothetical protein